MSNFFCGRADCRANTRLECSALVKKNPITGEGLDQLHCPFYMTKEKAEQDKQEVLAKLRAKGREDLIKKYWGGVMNP